MAVNSGYKINDVIYKYFDNSHFREFFEFNDADVLQWALTVMEKLYADGVVAEYVERNTGEGGLFEDEDFISFFLSKCHFYAILVIYTRFFENIESNVVLKQLFLDNLGIYYAVSQSESDLDYIFNNYINEVINRGTISVGSKKNENGNQVDGELLRLINYKVFNEYIFAPLAKNEIGWNIGNSSPLFRGTQLMENMTKAYEFDENVTDLSLYPLLSVTDVEISNDKMEFTHTTGINGLQYSDASQLIPVNSGVSYEISFRVECAGGDLSKFTFGVTAFNLQQQQIQLKKYDGTISTDNLFFNNITIHNQPDQELWVRGIIYAYSETDTVEKLNIGLGNNLLFNQGCEYIVPTILIDNTANTSDIVILSDIKVRSLNLPYSLGQLSANNFIVNYLKNNSGKSSIELENIIKKELLPYNSNYQPIYL